MSPSTKIVSANATKFASKKTDSIAPIDAPNALATIRWTARGTVELSGDCMTTRVAMTAQYASGNLTNRATNTESVAATAVRTACPTDGRFSSFQVQSFIAQSSPAVCGCGKLPLRRVNKWIALLAFRHLTIRTLGQNSCDVGKRSHRWSAISGANASL